MRQFVAHNDCVFELIGSMRALIVADCGGQAVDIAARLNAVYAEQV